MVIIENISLFASLASVVIALIFTIVSFTRRRQAVQVGILQSQPGAAIPTGIRILNYGAALFIVISLIFITAAIISRALETGHGPFSSMYEFAIAFAWGVILAGIIFRWRYHTAAVQNIGLIIATMLLIFAILQFTRPAPLVPALQQSTLLSAHVACAVVAYGTLTIGFGAAILVLVQNRRNSTWLPESAVLDTISYHSVIIGFPFLTLVIVLGALWADIAWGRYWSWDPKESASLVTWLIYAGYIHARAMRGWRGNKAASLLIIGFAAILLTFFGNFIFNGLHAYR